MRKSPRRISNLLRVDLRAVFLCVGLPLTCFWLGDCLGRYILGGGSILVWRSLARVAALDRSFAQFGAAVYRVNLQRASSAADGAVDGVPSDAAFHGEGEIVFEMTINALKIHLCIEIARELEMHTAVHSLEFQRI